MPEMDLLIFIYEIFECTGHILDLASSRRIISYDLPHKVYKVMGKDGRSKKYKYLWNISFSLACVCEFGFKLWNLASGNNVNTLSQICFTFVE